MDKIASVAQLLSSLKDAETGEQLYVDTHDKGFRKRFMAAAEQRDLIGGDVVVERAREGGGGGAESSRSSRREARRAWDRTSGSATFGSVCAVAVAECAKSNR